MSDPPGAGVSPAMTTIWHAEPAEAALAACRSTAAGLSDDEADRRLAEVGPNRLPGGKRASPIARFLRQFNSLFIYVLLASAAVSTSLGHLTDAAVILAVVVINALIGFFQEGKAESALAAISGMIDPRASVLRAGHRRTVPADRIVPGDIVLLEPGDRVPADLRLLRSHNLRIDESALTGESVPAEKAVAPVPAGAALGERASLAFSGTLVAAGQGRGVAVATGQRTELGRISTLVGSVEPAKTPLIRQMDGLARQLTIVILAVSAAAFALAVLVRAYPVGEAFMVVVGIAVAAIPEGLPAVVTITLAIGLERMARRNAIIRQLPAVETLGSVSVICTDKTGTLTRNEMMASRVVGARGLYVVSGSGYAPDGEIRLGEAEVVDGSDPALLELVRAAALCNDAALHGGAEGWRIEGDPMEGALLSLAEKAGEDVAKLRLGFPRTDEIPFDAAYRFMATLHHSHTDGAFILVKGAPEAVIETSAADRTGATFDPEPWRRLAHELAAEGHRVIALAAKSVAGGHMTLNFADIDRDMTLLGLVGFIDPPREEAIAAVADCRRAGVKVVMITGDHEATAREIARQLGLAAEPRVLSGRDLDALDEAGLRAAVGGTDVFARTTPEHKLRIVEALQANGLVVAMTGDGVNDAPALKRADVGIAMGARGTEAAKGAADMVLADDNFASIVAAVREGRTVYDNLMKVIGWTLPTNGGEAVAILFALAFGFVLPITPVQILWINMITAVALGLTLAFEPTEPDTMARPPRAALAPILTAGLAWRVVFVSLLFVVGGFGMFFFAEARGLPLAEARTIVVNTIVVIEIFYLFSVRFVYGTSLTLRGVVGTPAVLMGVGVTVAAQLLFTYVPWFQAVFGSVPLSFLDGLMVIAVGVVLLVVVEIEKVVRRLLSQPPRR